MIFSDLAQGGELGAAGIGEHDVELALFALDLSEEAIEIGEVRDVSLYAGDSCPISFTDAANSASRRPVMKT